ncbi:MAG: hypothetical protein E7622_05270 [Ruminococcaceae bacterium]|nr:hypothetical protein [Oscillospiraceae bacterium]
MDQNIKERKNPVLAIISIACTSLALLLIILGLVCILHLSQIDNNWGMIIVGLIFLIVPGVILGIIATIIAIISLIRKEKLVLSIVSISISAPITIFAIVAIITGL